MMNLKDAASYALEQLHEAGADDAAVIVTSGKIDELNIDGGEFSLMRSGFKSGLSLKAIKEQKTGNIHTNSCEKEAIDAAVKDCMAAVMAAQPDEAESIAPKAENMSFTAGALTPDRDKLFDRLQEYMDTLHTEYPKINMEQLIAKYDHDDILLMNTNGVEMRYQNGGYIISTMFSAHEGEKAGSFNGTGYLTDRLDQPLMETGMMRRLLRDAEADLTAAPVPEKFEGTLLVSPAFMGEFLGTALGCYAGDYALISDTSIWKDKLGQKVASSGITLETRPLDERIVCGERFDSNGYKSENGVMACWRASAFPNTRHARPARNALPTRAAPTSCIPASRVWRRSLPGSKMAFLSTASPAASPAPAATLTAWPRTASSLKTASWPAP